MRMTSRALFLIIAAIIAWIMAFNTGHPIAYSLAYLLSGILLLSYFWARSSIGGKAQGGLVAQGVQRQDAAFFDLLEQRQDEVAGNAKNFLRAVVLEGAQQRKAEGHGVSPGGSAKPG